MDKGPVNAFLVNWLDVLAQPRLGAVVTFATDDFFAAKERLIRARATHLDSLVARLHEPRVKRVIEPIVAGSLPEVDLRRMLAETLDSPRWDEVASRCLTCANCTMA